MASIRSRSSSPTAPCRPTRSCSRRSSSRGDAVVVERPTYDRTLLNLRNRGAELHAVELHTDGIDMDALAALLEGGVAPDARPRHPQLPEPGRLHARRREKRDRLLELARVPRLHHLRGRPLRRHPLRRRAAADHARRWTVAPAASSTPPRSPRPCARAFGWATSSARPSSSTTSGSWPRTPTSRRTWCPGDRQRVLPLRRDRALDRDGQDGAARARGASGRGARARAAGRPLHPPEGGYFMWVELPEGTDVAAPVRGRRRARASRSSRAPTSCSRAARTPCASPTRA